MHLSKLTAILFALSVGFVFGCQKADTTETPAEPSAEPAAAAEPAEPAEPAGDPGTIKVTVKLDGKAPKMKPLDRRADPFCAKTKKKDESVITGDGGTLTNAAVMIKKVRGKFDVPADAVTLSQDECMYTPRVQTAMQGQKINIKNGDTTLHNVHSYKGEKQANWFNKAQPPKSPDIPETLPAENLVTFKCDVHPWMAGYVALADHPFHGVSGSDGTVTLANVPSKGKPYTVVAWHEKYGMQEAEVTVEAGQTAEATITFKADAAAN